MAVEVEETVGRPLMPEGVEHRSVGQEELNKLTVGRPLMPEGVEHIYFAQRLASGRYVGRPLMPEGVEHGRLQRSLSPL